jgi:hypothetical protein
MRNDWTITLRLGAGVPTSVGLPVAGAGGAPDRGAIPDPPSCTPVTTTQHTNTTGIVPNTPQPGWGAPGASQALRGQHAAAWLRSDGLPADRHPADRAPPVVRGSPQAYDGGPRGVP